MGESAITKGKLNLNRPSKSVLKRPIQEEAILEFHFIEEKAEAQSG